MRPIETEIDPRTGMKNYIANESGDWATSAGYLRFSFARCIHFGRLYTCGASGKGKEEDLCEALRCLGQLLLVDPKINPPVIKTSYTHSNNSIVTRSKTGALIQTIRNCA